MSEVILVPGSFLSARAWRPVQDALDNHGLSSSAVELAGLGARDQEQADLEAHIQDVLEAVRATRDQTLLVAHSYAGVPAALAMARLAPTERRTVSLMLLGAMLPVAGQSIFDGFGKGATYLRKLSLKLGGVAIPVLTEQQLRDWGDHGLEGELLEKFKRVTYPHPIATYEAPADPSFSWETLEGRSIFVNLLRDPLPVPDVALELMDVTELDSGHWPMLTAPLPLAEVIVKHAR